MSQPQNLGNLKNTIEKLSVHHQTEILSILNDESNVTLNENKNGTFINLSSLDEEIIEKIKEHIKYINVQNNTLSSVENEKIRLETEYFSQSVHKSD